jgi:hypothetical protein
MTVRIKPDLIALEAAQLHDMKLDGKRAAEIAADVQRVCDAAAAVSREADFNDEPSRFMSALARLADTKSRV